MERVETLSNLLAEKIQKKSSISDLLNTVKMIESELIHLRNITAPNRVEEPIIASISISQNTKPADALEKNDTISLPEEKIVQVLQLDEEEVAAELEEIKKNAADKTVMATQNRPPVHFEEMDDIPTFANRNIKEEKKIETPISELTHSYEKPVAVEPTAVKELNESLPNEQSKSLNDMLKKQQAELSDTLQETPIKDLKKAIGINERFLYVNELFRGDDAMYEKSIKTINSFEIYAEAEFWIRRELKLRLGWNENYNTVKQFDQLVRRRFL
jgi:hypothetical protein